jgi:hypothetical protein
LAQFHFGERFGDKSAIQRGLRCVDALASLQGLRGEWPWFYLAPSGKVMENYQVYSVHQDGMASAHIHHAIKHGHATVCKQLERGFHWILENNEMNLFGISPVHLFLVHELDALLAERFQEEGTTIYKIPSLSQFKRQ